MMERGEMCSHHQNWNCGLPRVWKWTGSSKEIRNSGNVTKEAKVGEHHPESREP